VRPSPALRLARAIEGFRDSDLPPKPHDGAFRVWLLDLLVRIQILEEELASMRRSGR
jgi:hypothetical protein